MNSRPFIHTHERLAQVLRDARERSGMTQEQLAQETGAELQFIVDLELSHPRAEIGLAMNVLEAVGVRARSIPSYPTWMFGDDGRLKNKGARR